MDKIGKYEIREKIGKGGFGDVYKGYDPFIGRHVAVKTCSSDEKGIRERFDQEAKIAGNLHHRNITTVYDFGEENGIPYLVQEYLSGEDLDFKIKRQSIPYADKVHYLLQIARGLAYATNTESSIGTSNPPMCAFSKTARPRSWTSESPSWRSKRAA